MSTRVLLIDTGFSALPIYHSLRARGFEVWTIGNRGEDPLALLAPDRWIKGDYSDRDVLLDAVRTMGANFVVPGCTDVSMNSFAAAGLSSAGFVDTIAAIDALNIKTEFRALCSELRLSAPRRVSFDELHSLPMVIAKPADSFSGRGISIFRGSDVEAAGTALETARAQSPSAQVIFEEYIEGGLHSHSSFLENKKVVKDFIVREDARYSEFAVDLSYVLDWGDEDPRKRTLRESVEAIAEKLNLSDGLFHLQFILRGEVPFIVEATRRCPGDLYARLIELSTGFRYAEAYGCYFTGCRPAVSGISPNRLILRHTHKTPKVSNFTGIELTSNLPVIECYPVLRLGTAVDTSTYHRTAVLFMEAHSEKDLTEAFEHLRQQDAPRSRTYSRAE